MAADAAEVNSPHSISRQNSHQSRFLLYSIYAGAGRTALDMASMHEHTSSRQSERTLERTRAMERGAGTQASRLMPRLVWLCCNCQQGPATTGPTHAMPLQALEDLIAAYRIRHEQCTTSTSLPGKFVVMSMRDGFAGLGNQFPSIITGLCRVPGTTFAIKALHGQ